MKQRPKRIHGTPATIPSARGNTALAAWIIDKIKHETRRQQTGRKQTR